MRRKLTLLEIPDFALRVDHNRTSTVISYEGALLLREFQRRGGTWYREFGEKTQVENLRRVGLLFLWEGRKYGLTEKARDAKYALIRRE